MKIDDEMRRRLLRSDSREDKLDIFIVIALVVLIIILSLV